MIFFTDSELGRAGRRQSQVREPEMSTVDSSFYVKTAMPARSKYVTMLIPRRGDGGPKTQNKPRNVFLAQGFPTHRGEGDSDLEEIHDNRSVLNRQLYKTCSAGGTTRKNRADRATTDLRPPRTKYHCQRHTQGGACSGWQSQKNEVENSKLYIRNRISVPTLH